MSFLIAHPPLLFVCFEIFLHTHDFIILEFRVKNIIVLLPEICPWQAGRQPALAEKWPKDLSLGASPQAKEELQTAHFSHPRGYGTWREWEIPTLQRMSVLALPQFEINTKEGHVPILLLTIHISYYFWRTESLEDIVLSLGGWPIQTHHRGGKLGPTADYIPTSLEVISLPPLSKGLRNLICMHKNRPNNQHNMSSPFTLFGDDQWDEPRNGLRTRTVFLHLQSASLSAWVHVSCCFSPSCIWCSAHTFYVYQSVLGSGKVRF